MLNQKKKKKKWVVHFMKINRVYVPVKCVKKSFGQSFFDYFRAYVIKFNAISVKKKYSFTSK